MYKIITDQKDQRRMADLEHNIQHYKAKVYYEASNDQSSINTCQERVDILEEMMKDEREDGRQKIHCREEEFTETRKNSSETVSQMRCDPTAKLMKWNIRYMQNLKRQKIRGVLAANRQQRYLLRRKRRWVECIDSPLKLWLRIWHRSKKILMRQDESPVVRWMIQKRSQQRWPMILGEKPTA